MTGRTADPLCKGGALPAELINNFRCVWSRIIGELKMSQRIFQSFCLFAAKLNKNDRELPPHCMISIRK